MIKKMKRIVRIIPKHFRNKLKDYLNISPMKELDLEKIKKIRNLEKENLTNTDILENLITNVGLNDDEIFNYPQKLHQYCGKGLFIWQYPNQLSKYLIHLSKYKIHSYLEIGVKHGGTFIFTNEFLKRFNVMSKSIAVDLFQVKGLNMYKSSNKEVEIKVVDSHSSSFAKFINNQNHIDLVLIDGDHSYEGCKSDFELLKDHANIIVFHDIVGGGVPGVIRLWNEIKSKYPFEYNFYEYIDQYDEVVKNTGNSWLGIGLAVRKQYDIQ
jgi:cephalosporin hydroxylase